MDAREQLDPTAAKVRRTARDRPDQATHAARSVADPPTADQASVLALQRLAGNASVSRILAPDDEAEAGEERSPVLDVVGSGGGQPLAADLRHEMEGRLGDDFGDVRVHTDQRASESARSISAQAYTVGSDVVFRSDRWSPESTDGKRTLAHELTHVAQQRAGPVSGTPAGGGISLSDSGDAFEQAAERTADAAMAGHADATPMTGAPAAQRQEEPEEEEELAQTLPAQRQEEPEEEEELAQTLPAQRQEEPEEEEELAQTLPAQRQEEPDDQAPVIA